MPILGILTGRLPRHALQCARCGVGAGAGVAIGHPVSTLDIVPTVLELLGVPGPPDLDGESLLTPRKGVVISQSSDVSVVRGGRWKLRLEPRGKPSLVDLESDPTESEDVAALHPERVRSLQAALRARARKPLAKPAPRAALAPDELESLRVLGYVE